MYGIILDSIMHFVVDNYGKESWLHLVRESGIMDTVFSARSKYNESHYQRLVGASGKILRVQEDEFQKDLGVFFIQGLLRHSGYKKLLGRLGRNFKDFFTGLDSIYVAIRSEYIGCRPPLFSCNNESSNGITIHYCSKRPWMLPFIIGTLEATARFIYGLNVRIHHPISSSESFDEIHIEYSNLYVIPVKTMTSFDDLYETLAPKFLQAIVPFGFGFDSELKIIFLGETLETLLPFLYGKSLIDSFRLIQPDVELTWTSLLRCQNVSFEFESNYSLPEVSGEAVNIRGIFREPEPYELVPGPSGGRLRSSFGDTAMPVQKQVYNRPPVLSTSGQITNLILKGPLVYIDDWDRLMFFGNPKIEDYSELRATRVFLADLPAFNAGRDIILGNRATPSFEWSGDLDALKSQLARDVTSITQCEQHLKDVTVQNIDLAYCRLPTFISNALRNGLNFSDTWRRYDNIGVMCLRFVVEQTSTDLDNLLPGLKLINTFTETLLLEKKIWIKRFQEDTNVIIENPYENKDDKGSVFLNLISSIQNWENHQSADSGIVISHQVGIHYGWLFLGLLDRRGLDYQVIGEAVEVASAMMNACNVGGVLVSQKALRNFGLDETRFVVDPHEKVNCPNLDEDMVSYSIRKVYDQGDSSVSTSAGYSE